MTSSTTADVVIVGAGLAGYNVAHKLVQAGYVGTITLVGNETEIPYDRPPLSKNYQQNGDESSLTLTPELPPQVRQLLGRKALALDTNRKRLVLDDGDELRWERLVITTGARPKTLPHLQTAANVHTLRTLDDARTIRASLVPGASLLVIGAGPIGLELAATAMALGVRATVVEQASRVMSRCVPAAMAERILDHHRHSGIDIRLGRTVAQLDEDGGLAILDNGQYVPADVVVVGIGVRANDELAKAAGIACDDGIVVDHFGQTSVPHVYAAGDVTRQRHPIHGRLERIETWSNAQNQAQVVATFLHAPAQAVPSQMAPWFWSDQGSLRLQCAGDTQGDSQAWHLDAAGGRTLVQWTQGCVSGVASLNASRDFVQLKRLIVGRPTITPSELTPNSNIRSLVQQALARSTEGTPVAPA